MLYERFPVSYSVSADTMIEEGTKSLRIVKAIEAAGYRCALHVVAGVEKEGQAYFMRLTVKRSDERLNVSKIAYPFAHPSMTRRHFAALIERSHVLTRRRFLRSYGTPCERLIPSLYPDAVLLPARICDVEEFISKLKEKLK